MPTNETVSETDYANLLEAEENLMPFLERIYAREKFEIQSDFLATIDEWIGAVKTIRGGDRQDPTVGNGSSNLPASTTCV